MSLDRNVVRVRQALRWTAKELASKTVGKDLVRLEKTYRVITQIESRGQRHPNHTQHSRLLPELADALKIAPSRLVYDDLGLLSDSEISALRVSYGKPRPYDESRPLGEQVEAADLLQRSTIRMVLQQCRTDEELMALRRHLLEKAHRHR
jgi:transcriptional regulator with XRE-family HTH domain